MSDNQISNLLKVLDMPEEKQQKWWQIHYGESYGCRNCLKGEAFRLRDEACKESCETYYEALEVVYNYRIKDKHCSFYAFQTYQIQPIEMIIAAMIAKELNKKT